MKKTLIVAFLLSLLSTLTATCSADSGTYKDLTSEAGSLERKQILNTARTTAEQQLSQKVKFHVRFLAVSNQWAIGLLVPLTLSGKPIDWSSTGYRNENPSTLLSGWLEVLLKKEGSTWQVVDSQIGRLDKDAFDVWEEKFPGIPSDLLMFSGLATNCNSC
jgi:predicted small secreted protein